MNPLDSTIQSVCPTVMVPRHEPLALLDHADSLAEVDDGLGAHESLAVEEEGGRALHAKLNTFLQIGLHGGSLFAAV